MQAYMFKREDNQNFLILTIYVDDCIQVSNIPSLQNIKWLLQIEFDMSDEGEVHFTLGNAIVHNRVEGWTMIHKQKYLISKLKEYNMLDCKPITTPMQARIRLSKKDSTPSQQNQQLYPQIEPLCMPL